MVRPRVFLDFSVNGEAAGRVIFELYNDSAPRTSENFRALCTGEKGLTSSGVPLYYKNSIIHRSIRDFMIQGGDFTKRNGSGGESIYGGTFPDEDLTLPLDSEGLLCMANRGPDTNGSQFFVTLRECPHLNGKHVVFGKVIRGYDELIKKILQVPVDEKDRPTTPIVISSCGELELRKKPEAQAQPTKEVSESEERHKSPRRRSKRSASADSDQPRQRKKKSKKKKRTEAEEETPKEENKLSGEPHQETEEEYDARLEREENERLEAARKQELERVKRRYESELEVKDGVRFKGRGRMKFIDPEISNRQ